jgi:diguanylate cyclase (GGDEF)-like protein
MGETGHVLYVLCSGEAQIRIGEIVFETVSKGDVIGEMALLDDDVQARSATAVALTDCEIVAVDRNRLLELVRLEPEFALQLAKLTVRRLRATNFLAHHDSLTRLPNRALFQEACRKALLRAHRRNATVGVLYVDLDQFQSVNQSLGNETANRLLCDIATRIRALHHELDVVARLGEDEFAILLEDLPGSHAVATSAQAFLEDLSRPFSIAGENVYITASIGISCFPHDGEEPQVLLKNANAAMRRAKEQGRNACSFYSAELNAIAVETHRLRNHLRQAIERKEFSLNYQPRVALPGGKFAGVEALLRWRHPELGMVPPGKFIPIAEQAGLIEEIGEWVLRTACAQQKAWLRSGIAPSRMAVNLSARQLKRLDLSQRIAAILEQTGLEPRYLELEITESAVMEDPARTVFLLKELRAMGIAIALDDFGTEYSSLGYLKQFPLDYMKIDQCFVRGIPDSSDDVAITKTIITLAKNLRLRVVAEGVETPTQLAFLTDQACDEVQGYFFSRPVPADQAEDLLRENLRARAA